MDLIVESYNSHDINSSTYETIIDSDSPLFARAGFEEIERAGTWPVKGAKRFGGHVMILAVTVKSGTISAARDQIGEWFNEEDDSLYQLVASNSGTNYYVDGEALGIVSVMGSVIRVAVHVPEPIWKSSTLQSDSINITASDQTNNVAVAGNRNARPIFTLTPTNARTGSYSYMRYIAIANRTTRIYKDAINLPDSDWNTQTLVSGGKMQSDGDDCRVFNDEIGQEEYRWFGGGGINSTTTRVFSNVTLPPRIEMVVSGAISNVGGVSTIAIKRTTANILAMRELAKVSYKFVAIDMGSGSFEIFKFTTANDSSMQITGCTRAQKGTSNQSHSDGATLRHIHGYYIMYGNSSASAPTTDDGYKPIIDLTNSTNTSHVYASFYDALYPNRTCMWTPQVIRNVGAESEIYTATQDTFADEATVIGTAGKVYKVGNSVRAPTFDLIWSLYHPAGFTTLTWSGYKYRFSTNWPAVAFMQKSNDGKQWTNITTIETSPSSAATWSALSSHSSVSLSGTYLNIRNRFAGTISAKTDNMVAMELTDLTGTIDSSNTPLINFGAETTNNYMEPRITNNNTGQWLEVSALVPLNTTIVIDTDALTCTLADGTTVPIRLDDESRPDWLPLLPNVTNVLKYTESGVSAVTWKTEWRDRANP